MTTWTPEMLATLGRIEAEVHQANVTADTILATAQLMRQAAAKPEQKTSAPRTTSRWPIVAAVVLALCVAVLVLAGCSSSADPAACSAELTARMVATIDSTPTGQPIPPFGDMSSISQCQGLDAAGKQQVLATVLPTVNAHITKHYLG